jgi:diguanylate cyclase (GGDEF)-like protein
MIRLAVSPGERKILVVDDDLQMLEIVKLCLITEGYDVKTAESADEAFPLLEQWAPHVVILDVNLPGITGLQALQKLKTMSKQPTVLLVSGNNSTEAVCLGLDAGADDYICKPFAPLELLSRLRTHLRIRDLTEQLLEANEKLKELVDIDDLTGLLNMRSMFSKLEHELLRGQRFNRTVCVIMMDIDHFKLVNDGHDHLFGSFVISEIGKIVKASTRTVDIAARYGGDEFLIVLSEIDKKGAQLFCERLRATICSHNFESGSDRISLTSSIGFTITDPNNPEVNPREIVRIADRALYDAKHAGRNRVCSYDLAEPHIYAKFFGPFKKAQ